MEIFMHTTYDPKKVGWFWFEGCIDKWTKCPLALTTRVFSNQRIRQKPIYYGPPRLVCTGTRHILKYHRLRRHTDLSNVSSRDWNDLILYQFSMIPPWTVKSNLRRYVELAKGQWFSFLLSGLRNHWKTTVCWMMVNGTNSKQCELHFVWLCERSNLKIYIYIYII